MTNYNELYEKLARLQWLLQRDHMQSHAKHGPMADPSRGQGRVLTLLKLQKEISTKDLSYVLGIRQQSLNELLNKLEAKGYILRTPSEEDRRVMMISLTDKGREEENPKKDYAGIFNCLSEEEQQSFGDYLDRVISALEEKVGTGPEEADYEWIEKTRARMGEEQFSRLFAMGRGRHPFMGAMGGIKRPPFGHGFEGGPDFHQRPPYPPAPPFHGEMEEDNEFYDPQE